MPERCVSSSLCFTREQSLAQMNSFLLAAGVIETEIKSCTEREEIPQNIILSSAKLWDITCCNIGKCSLTQWFNKVTTFFLNLVASFDQYDSSYSNILFLIKSLYASGLSMVSLTFRINLIKILLYNWSAVLIENIKMKNEKNIASIKDVTKEAIKGMISLVNQYDKPSKDLCNFDALLDWCEEISYMNNDFKDLVHVYYRVIYQLLNKKGHIALGESLTLRYLDYLKRSISLIKIDEKLQKEISDCISLFIITAINVSSLDHLFEMIISIECIESFADLFTNSMPKQALRILFSGQYQNISLKNNEIIQKVPQINFEQYKLKLRSVLLIQKLESCVEKYSKNGVMLIPLSFVEKELFINSNDDGNIDQTIRNLVLYLTKCVGVGIFSIDSVGKTLSVKKFDMLLKKYSILRIEGIPYLREKLVNLRLFVSNLLPSTTVENSESFEIANTEPLSSV